MTLAKLSGFLSSEAPLKWSQLRGGFELKTGKRGNIRSRKRDRPRF